MRDFYQVMSEIFIPDEQKIKRKERTKLKMGQNGSIKSDTTAETGSHKEGTS